MKKKKKRKRKIKTDKERKDEMRKNKGNKIYMEWKLSEKWKLME